MKQKILRTALFCATLLAASLAHSQVTIGSGEAPVAGALLDLKESGKTTKGLGLPRVKLTNLKPNTANDLSASIGASGAWNKDEHIGLMVYNVKERTDEEGACPGIHIWDGAEWQPLVPYPVVETRKTPVGTPTKGAITLLGGVEQAINPADPKWAEFGKNPADYAINAVTPSMTDADGNVYASKRFYVGYQTVSGTFRIEKNISCDASTPNWIDLGNIAETTDTFVDGVWITSNVYSTKSATTNGAFDKGSDIDNMARLNPAYYSSATGAVKIGVNGLSATTMINYGDNTVSTNTRDKSVSQKVFASEFGLLYTQNQASQVCPTGWSLPNDSEWHAIALTHGGSSVAGGKIRKNRNFYVPTNQSGYKWGSETTPLSGFNAVPSGYVDTDGAYANYFSADALWWSSSTSLSYRNMNYLKSNLYAYTLDAGFYFSVRCVKN